VTGCGKGGVIPLRGFAGPGRARVWVSAGLVAVGVLGSVGSPTVPEASSDAIVPLTATISGDSSPTVGQQTCVSVFLTTVDGTPVQASYIALGFDPTPGGGGFNPLPSGSTDASGNGSICFTYADSRFGGGSYTLQLEPTVILPGGEGQATSNTLSQTPGVPLPSLPVTVSSSTSNFTVDAPLTITVDVSDGNVGSPNLGLQIWGFGSQFSVQSATSTVGSCSGFSGSAYDCSLGAFGPGDTATTRGTHELALVLPRAARHAGHDRLRISDSLGKPQILLVSLSA
jgi:hypothetical protein